MVVPRSKAVLDACETEFSEAGDTILVKEEVRVIERE